MHASTRDRSKERLQWLSIIWLHDPSQARPDAIVRALARAQFFEYEDGAGGVDALLNYTRRQLEQDLGSDQVSLVDSGAASPVEASSEYRELVRRLFFQDTRRLAAANGRSHELSPPSDEYIAAVPASGLGMPHAGADLHDLCWHLRDSIKHFLGISWRARDADSMITIRPHLIDESRCCTFHGPAHLVSPWIWATATTVHMLVFISGAAKKMHVVSVRSRYFQSSVCR